MSESLIQQSSSFKPYAIAIGVITIVLVVVIVMIYRTVGSLKSSVFSVVEQHNNAKAVLDNHATVLRRIEGVLVEDDDEYDDEMLVPGGESYLPDNEVVDVSDEKQPVTKKTK